MKIVCDNCATKYSIADEKVVGKVFKIRCKKCSHIIVVKGTSEAETAAQQQPAQEAPSQQQEAAAEQPATAVWHLVIDREQVGPMSADEVREKFRSGQIDAESYAWREGFEDWLKLASIDEFRELSLSARPPADDQETRRSNSADVFNQAAQAARGQEERAPSADLFNSAVVNSAPAQVSEPVRTAAPNAATMVAGIDDYAAQTSGRASRQISDEETMGLAGPSGNSSSGVDIKPMTGARSENSVLFSLNNLQALATGGAAGGGGGGGGGGGLSASQPRPGYASSQNEGSGLIDIRQMAAQTLSAGSFSSAVGGGSRPDELPMVNDTPMFSPMAPSVLLPSSEAPGMPKWVWGLVGVGGVLFIGMIAVMVMLLKSPPAPPPTTPVATGNTGTPAGEVASNKPVASPTQPAGTVPPADGTKPPVKDPGTAPATPPSGDPGEKKHHSHADRDRGDRPAKAGNRDRDTTVAPPTQPKVDTPPPPPEPKKPKVAKPKDDLDLLLDSASPGGGGRPKADAVKKDAPEQLSMDMIKTGLKGVNGTVQACKDQFKTPGTYMVKITIAHSGRVSDASVPGKSGDPTADCVARAVKSAHFPEFTGDPQTLSYPFILR